MRAPDKPLAALSCKVISSANVVPMLGYWKAVKVTCKSTLREASFTLETNPLEPTLLGQFKQWEQHGFTVLELHRDWQRRRYNGHGTWKDALIMEALEKVVALVKSSEERSQMEGYDEELAQAVLEHLNKIAPTVTNNMELKYAMPNEPSDDALLQALAILHLDKYISGVGLPDSQSGTRKLAAMANVQITAEGRRLILARNRPSEALPAVHQYINNGQAGAMGPNSVGTIHYQQQWSQVENQTNLAAVADRFEEAIKNRASSAASSADFAELQLMAQAKEQAQKHEGSKLVETITAMGRTALPILTSAGAHGLVSLLEHKLGVKLS